MSKKSLTKEQNNTLKTTTISREDRHTLLRSCNDTDAPYPMDKTITQLFEAQVDKTPNNIALVFAEQKLTYGQLNEKANQLAHAIRAHYQNNNSKGIKPDTLIGLYLDRSLEMVISILGVLKAGGAYVPISPEYPQLRAQYILDDTQTSLIITQPHYKQQLNKLITKFDLAAELLALDDVSQATPTANLISINTSKDLAYVMHTSARTGQPKGVMVEHKNVVNYSYALTEHVGDFFNRVDFSANYCFDFSITTILCPVLVGRCIYIFGKDISNIEAYLQHIKTNKIDFIKAIPSIASVIFANTELKVKTLLLAGEILSKQCVAQLSNNVDVIYDEYGPTESTVGACIANIYPSTSKGIAKSYPNIKLYNLSASLTILPIGATGELYIGGAGLARGYLNQPELTSERFIDNPFATIDDKAKGYDRLYKTGDLVRLLLDGNLEYLGRNDCQVKIRGYRIELGEIESALIALKCVKQAVVVDLEKDGHKYLAAYLIKASGIPIDIDKCRDSLALKLPDYMLPATFTVLDSIPLTINGKLDRNSLPTPEFVNADKYVAPRNELEEQLCNIWQEVLSVKKVGIDDNFYQLGGNSITAIRLSAACRQQFKIDIPLALLFAKKTIKRLAPCINKLQMRIKANVGLTQYPLSFAQERLLFIENFEQGSNLYHIPYFVQLADDANLGALTASFNVVIHRHPVFNSVYRTDQHHLAYQVQLGGDIPIHMHVLTESQELLAVVKKEISRPFDLTTEPSLRLHCYEKNARQYLLILCHHIAFDGLSWKIFINELSQAYQALCQGAAVELPHLDISYGDYVLWQRSYLQGENLTKLLDFWQTQLSGYEQLQLPTDYSRPIKSDHEGGSIDIELDARLSEQLRKLAKVQKTTLYTVLLSGFYITLSAMSGQTDILLGTAVANRKQVQTRSLIGCFVNTLVMRAGVQATMTIEEFIRQVHGIVRQALAHQALPFERLVDALKVERDPSRHPIFQVMLSVKSFTQSHEKNIHIPFKSISREDSKKLYTRAPFDLNLNLNTSQPTINGDFNYALSLFNEKTINRISGLYQRVLVAMVANQQLAIGEISLLSDFDRHTLLHTWNDTTASYPMDKTIAQLFEEQVDKKPDNIALVFAKESLTYRQLNQRANQLAYAIRAHYQNNNSQDIKPDTLIGLYLDRSLEMVISIIAVLKAGGAYVPISPEYSKLRVQFMFEDTQTSLIITQQHYKPQLNNWIGALDMTATLLAIDDVSDDNPTANLAAISTSKDLAYVIYTSGTTGTPKGVMIEHKNVVNYLYALAEHVGDLFNRVDFSANYCFDLSITTNLCPLLVGSCIYIFGKNISDIESYLQHIRANEIDFVKTTPSLASVIFANTEIKVKTLLLGGEILSKQCVAQLSNNVDVIYDEYGPTESTVGALIANVLPLMSKGIGKSYSNIKLYNLSPSLTLLPIGTPGELYIGGAGLARGYLNQHELTNERFIDNPFATPDDKAKGYDRLYKTGDLVRLDQNGNLEYLGRNDCQVKIRGYRIELGEIESALSALKDVKQAVVVDLEKDGHKYLAAYLIKASGMGIDLDIDIDIDIDIEACRDSLALKLPDYMLPVSFTVLDSIPLTINGKLDRRALPAPDFVSADKYVAPRNDLEEQLCNIWQEVLSVKRVGIDDNFFRIGGDSIVSIGLVSKMRSEGFSLQVKDIFDAPTVAQVSRLLNEQQTCLKIKTEHGVLTGAFDLLPIQSWFFAQKLANPQHFNQAFIIKIPGEIKYAEIENSLQALTDQHDMLRCVFLKKASSKTKSYQQQYRDNIDGMCEPLYALNIAGLNSEELDEKLTQLQSNFNYINGPTWQAAHLTGHIDGRARLFFAFHHLIIDVVSWRIIAQDIKQLLTKQLLTKQLLTKQVLTKQALPPKGSSYRQWIRAVQHYALNHQDERAYWQGVCADQEGLPALGAVAYHKVSLSVHQTDVLLHQANLGFHTQINDLLLSALAISLFEVLGSDVNHVTLEGHGREVIDETLDVSNTVGWFTSMYPVRLKAHKTISATIIHTKEMLRVIPNKGISYGALHQQQAFAMSLPKISFNYLGQLGAQSDNEESSTWQISQEDAGEMIASDNTDHLLVNINGVVQAGILTFNIASRLSSVLTKEFEAHFHSALVEVIEQAALKAKSGGVNTPSDYAVKGLSIDHLDFLERRLTTNKIVEIFPANSLQQGFISHALHYPEDDAYRVQLLLDYNEALDIDCYQQAWCLASQRYPALRACFDWRDGLVQIITADSSINLDNFTIKDISHLPQAARAQEIIKIQQLDRKVTFDLSTPGLMRFTVIKQHANLVTVMQTTHHSISDGWSGPILLQQVHEYYNQLVVGMQVQIKVDRAFVNAQHYYIKAKSAALDHWKKAKERFQAANDLNFLFTTAVDLAELKTIAEPCASELIIKGDLYKQLKQMCQNQAITLNVAVQFAWHKLLHIYSGDEQTIVGTTVSGRDLPVDGIENSVGLYINTLPLTVDWDNSISVSAILNNIQKSIAELNSYSHVCLADLQANGQRLFHSLFVFENYPSPIDTNTSGIENHLTFRAAIEKTDYPLSVTAYEKNESLVVKLHYSDEWLRQNQARRLLNQIQLILASIAKNTDHSHQQISLMDDLERHTLVHTWNDTDAPYPMDKTLTQLFEEQVDKTPDNVALVFEEESLTYRQLNEIANQLAHAIRAHYQKNNSQGIQADTLIGLYLDRSLEMVISILGAVKAGGAYVPISPEYPQLRVQYILNDTQTSLVITQQHYKRQLNKWTAKLDLVPNLLAIDDVSDDNPTANLAAINGPKDLAYVIYTSGTTGKPKGVMIEHLGVSNLIISQTSCINFDESDAILWLADYIFDASVEQLFLSLLNGAMLHIPTKSDIKDVGVIKHKIVALSITYLHATPQYLNALGALEESHYLKRVMSGGERISAKLVACWGALLTNAYGPTESTVISIQATQYGQDGVLNSIGHPINNTHAYVLNQQQNIVPIGSPGELYIGGAGLARGYLNQPELTGERFIENPFATPDEKAKGYNRLYKTGDLVRWRSDGNLEYLGRNDCQVKIRGYRIELGEIESALSSLKDVKQAVVVDFEKDGHKYLAAYLIKASGMVSEIEIDIDIEACRDSLSLKLPDYMLPATFTVLDSIPLTINGKLDRRALPTPEFVSADNYVAPRNELEELLCDIWQEVLSVTKVGIADNFYQLGGNSITAIRLTAACRQQFKIDIPLALLFEKKTIEALSGCLDKLQMLVIAHVERDQYPLSFAQERLLFIENFEQGSNAYHIPYFVQLADDVNLSALTAAFNVVIHRHPVLNSVYRRDEQNKAYQVQLGVDISMHMHALNDSHELLAELKKEISRPFDLTTEPSIRLHCYEKNARHYLLMLFHHIGFDGWSTNIFMDELEQAYRGLCQGVAEILPNLDISYGDYALWQSTYLQGENLTKLLDFWQQQLSGYEQLQLPTDYPRPKQINYQGRNIDFQLDARLSEQLRSLAKACETTLYTVLLSSFYISLSAMSGQTDVLLGTPSDNRDHAQTQSLIGFFVNTLVLRADVQAAMTIEEFITQVHGIVRQAKAYQELPFERLVDVLNVERDASRHPIFQVMFAIESSETSYQSNNGLPFMPSEFASSDDLYRLAKFDLSLLVDVSQPVIKGSFNYALSLFNEETIKRISEIYHQVLVAVVANQQLPIGDISLLSKIDRHTLLHTWNDTTASYPMDKTIAQLFEVQVDKTPDNVALVFEGEELTYSQLNNKANQLAHAIRAHYQNNNSQCIKPDTLIGLYLDRSLEMVISILGVLKAGGAYVPISPEYPQLRVQFMLDDTQTSLVITPPHYKRQLNNWIGALDITPMLLAIDDVSDDNPTANLAAINGPKDLAYVIYTSGTTGTPKGVMIEHLGVTNLIFSQISSLDFKQDESVLWLADYIFDASVEQLFLSLFNGAVLHIPSRMEILDIGIISQKIVQSGITHLHSTPQYLNALGALEEPHYLNRVISGAEAISKELVSIWGPILINSYGPTESTVTSIQATQYGQDGVLNNIGRPINNTQIYVLNQQKNIVPIGAPGELYIGGVGLARGYLNQSELTGERFIDNPFATPDDKAKGYDRLYKTGDLVRWAHDGNLEYLGRNDCQVKIRGYRIELGEIESALSALKDVKQAVVVDFEKDGHKYLAAYLIKASSMVSDIDIDIDIDKCRDSLALKLPDYMLPATFTVLDSIPLTINGKLDRRALPPPYFVSADKYVAPRNELEEQLCNIWQEVLGVKKVGIDDNFFRIGGDSIVSIGLVSKMRREGFSLQVKDIFDAPTVAQLGCLLNAPATCIKIKTEQGVLTGTFDLLPIQDSFFAQKLAKPYHFNQAFIIKIPGEIKYAEIEQALQALTDQHDMLRCVFLEKESSKTTSYQQQYRDNIDGMCEPLYALNIADLNSEELDEKLTQLQSNFNYINGPTWQAAHLTGHIDGRARLFFAFHHLIIDVVSWRIIAQDIKQLLTKQLLTKQLLSKQALTKQALPPKGSSYRQWIRAVQHYALNHQDERAYWQGVCADQAGLPALGTVAYHKVSLSERQTDVLLHQANLGFHTQINDLLLSALAISLFEVLGSDVNHVTLEGHGREVIDETLDVSNTVGWFTSMYPVRLKAQQTISATIIHTKEMLSAIPNKGIGYGALHKQQAFAMSLPKISFNYLGQLGAQSDNEESSTWQISQEDAGQMIASDNTDHLLVNINGAVQAGILTFNIDSRLSSVLTKEFEAHFHSALVEVIEQAALKAKSGGVNTPSDYAVKGLSIDHLDFLERRLTTNKIVEIFHANSLQQGFISHALHYPEDDAYRVQLLLDYNEALDIDCYQQAWCLASQSYPALRACFDWRDGLVQIITADSSINLDNFTIKDISHLPQAARAQEIIKIQQLDRKVPFDLSTPGLMRFTLIKQHAKLVTVMQTTHHSISDGWSGPILLQQVHEYYNQLVLGMQVQIKVDRAFVDAQQYYSKAKSAATKHWKKAKERFQAANDLNFLFTTPVDLAQLKTIAEPCASELIIKGDLYKQLKQMCRNQAITLNVAVQFAWHKLLHIYSGDEQTIVGTTVSGRDLPVDGIESSVGLYINTLPLTVDWDNSVSVSAILNNIQKSIAEINSYNNVSLADLQANGQRLFHSLFVFENYPSPMDTNTSGIENHLTFRVAIEKTDYPLSVTAYEENESLVVKLHYSEEWLRQNQARRLLNQIQLILASIAKNTDHSHQQISLMDDLERHTLLHTWNDTTASYPMDKTITQLFEEQVDKNPDNIALVFAEQKLTYSQLNQKANQLAYAIRAHYQKNNSQGIQADTLIGLYLDRSLDMVISILGAVKAGGAYVPISPEYPQLRVQYILGDTQTSLIITQPHYKPQLNNWSAKLDITPTLLALDDVSDENPTANLAAINGAKDLAYVIYTSGTTGTPKGVLQLHTNVVSLFESTDKYFQFTHKDTWVLFHEYTFDFSVWELWGALLYGGQLIIPTKSLTQDTCKFVQLCVNSQVTILNQTPAAFYLFIEESLSAAAKFPCLRNVIFGGDKLNLSLLKPWWNCYAQDAPLLVNMYGITETTVHVTYKSLSPKNNLKAANIGKPLNDLKAFVLNTQKNLVPIGAPGELYIGGAGLARGYLNQAELTHERFIDNPFATTDDKAKGYNRLYKTSDLVRWRDDGNLEYLGRNDCQVKIRGYRIELGEIESALSALKDVKHAVVVDLEKDGHKYLAAYLIKASSMVSDIDIDIDMPR